jgi:hypothetical protein
VLWRDGCDDDNGFCCPKGERSVDFHQRSGECKLCRKAYYHKYLLHQTHSIEFSALEKVRQSYDGITDSTGGILLVHNHKDNKTASLTEGHLSLIEEIEKELDHIERMENLKLEEQRDACRMKSKRAAKASLEDFDSSLLMPPPRLKGHPIENILQLSSRIEKKDTKAE